MEEPPRILLSSTEVLFHGLKLLGFDEKRQNRVNRKKNLARFCSHYASDTLVYAVLLERLQTTTNEKANVNAYIDKLGTTSFQSYYFMAIHLLACYPTEEEAEAVWSKEAGPCSKSWSTWSWKIIECISHFVADVIYWPDTWSNPDNPQDDTETIFILTVDGVHCPIEEPTLPSFEQNEKYYSHKYNAAGLDYELGISIFTQRCVWCAGPYPAGKNDISIFKHKLLPKMQEARNNSAKNVQFRAIGDKGYRGVRDFLSVPSSQDTPEVRDFKSRALSRHETFNGRLKNFDCLDVRFRHSIDKHRMCFHAVLVIVQMQLDNGSPLFVV